MAGVAAPAMAANLLVNGNFEATGFGGTTTYYNIGTAPGTGGSGGPDHPIPSDFGWKVPTQVVDDVVVNNVDIVANNNLFAPKLTNGGAYVLDLVGYGSTGAIEQSIGTVANQLYNLTFEYSSNNGINGPTAQVDGNGVIGSVTGTHAWQTFTGSFVGTGSPVNISITEGVGGGNAGVFLDNVSVSAAPEPSTWALMMLGIGGVGAAARMARRKEGQAALVA
ncbi:MAG TPA: PEP-CTERM sorting domain-containing protein [Caulobacteraceae bacterium]